MLHSEKGEGGRGEVRRGRGGEVRRRGGGKAGKGGGGGGKVPHQSHFLPSHTWSSPPALAACPHSLSTPGHPPQPLQHVQPVLDGDDVEEGDAPVLQLVRRL